jgi:hypothetical protein
MSCSRQSITQAWNHGSPPTARAFFRILLKAVGGNFHGNNGLTGRNLCVDFQLRGCIEAWDFAATVSDAEFSKSLPVTPAATLY